MALCGLRIGHTYATHSDLLSADDDPLVAFVQQVFRVSHRLYELLPCPTWNRTGHVTSAESLPIPPSATFRVTRLLGFYPEAFSYMYLVYDTVHQISCDIFVFLVQLPKLILDFCSPRI